MSAFDDVEIDGNRYRIVDLSSVAGEALHRLPYTLRILLENIVRNGGDGRTILDWLEAGSSQAEIPFLPERILMHDTTCGPALVDIAAMRSTLAEAGIDPRKLNPILPIDVSSDHSIAVDSFATASALQENLASERRRNGERYRFMKWATKALAGVTVHPPGTGIMHTLNLERLATVATVRRIGDVDWAVPDTLIGTDSHTPMINGIGVLGWGVGGLEAESVMFGVPTMMRIPEIVGVRLVGRMGEGVLATDLALVVTQRLREIDLQDRCVEFFGPGVSTLSAGDRAVVANMTPEFGGNTGYFPIDENTLAYLSTTGRASTHVRFVEGYARRQGLWFDPAAEPRYSSTIEIDIGSVWTSLAGPRRPQDRISPEASALALVGGAKHVLAGPPDGAVAIAAITSCTNTSDPRLLIAAGLLARKARQLGLKPPPWVKTSLAPGSPTAARYLRRTGLLDDLSATGFDIVGFGCTTCIGNSGALPPVIEAAVASQGIRPVAVLSGNRNFPGRVHPQLDLAYLASPPMVVAFALAGDINRNILSEPLGRSATGANIRLADIWPSGAEIDEAVAAATSTADFADAYEEAEANPDWAGMVAPDTAEFPWDATSTYIRRPPFASLDMPVRLGTYIADPILVLGDDITTDHISPAGAIPPKGDAGRHLQGRGADVTDLNVFASRRGNWEVMLRGLFTNRTVRNLLDPSLAPGQTIHAGSGEAMALWQAADRYRAEGRSVVIVAGERYGMGSSRDWAAKGVALLGARAVLALGFERIHRSNLIGMGVLPIRLPASQSPQSLALKPGDQIEIEAPPADLRPRGTVTISIRYASGEIRRFEATAAIETVLEIEILKTGGLLPLMLKRTAKSAQLG